MLTGQVGLGPTSTTSVYGGVLRLGRRRVGVFRINAVVNNKNNTQNHYAVLGVPRSASPADIKKAYRLLARKWHPDVSEDSQSGEVFKSIHLAYQVLSDEATRIQYDRVLRSREYTLNPNVYCDFETENGTRVYGWSELRQKRDKYEEERYHDGGENFSFYTESDEEPKMETGEKIVSFMEVVLSVSFSVVLMQTFGCGLSLMYSSLRASFDWKLDTGYKLGYLVAWTLGGRVGVLLTICLSFASWAWGKNSSSIVSLVCLAMWAGSRILDYTPLLPRGALLALLYMSAKLQRDLLN